MIAQDIKNTHVPVAPCASRQAHRVIDAARLRLRDTGYKILTQAVSCDFHEGVLTLRGRVPSYYMKQIALSAVRDIDEIRHVDNRLEVA